MKKSGLVSILITAIFLILLTGCTRQAPDPRPLVITTLFPQYDFVKQIADEKINLKLLLNPGVEAHAFEPTPRDIVEISKASLFIYTGDFMEPWAGRILKGVKNDRLTVVDASKNIILLGADDHEHDLDMADNITHKNKEYHNGTKDPHIWTDPLNVLKMIDNILNGLVKADPENSAYYIENAEKYKNEIIKLHKDFVSTFKKINNKKIIYAGHFAFGYFSHRYGLEHESPYKGFSPNAEPNPREIVSLIKSVENSKIKVIYYEELVDPRVARVIAEHTGAEMLLLHGAHNISKDEFQEGVTYISIMKKNLEALKYGMGYSE